MRYRTASPADLPSILAIQNGNLHANLTEEERRDGFLSAAFTAEHFMQMAREVALMVADDAGQICPRKAQTTEDTVDTEELRECPFFQAKHQGAYPTMPAANPPGTRPVRSGAFPPCPPWFGSTQHRSSA